MNEQSSARLGAHSLDHFVLQVPDLEPAKRFYTAFGLDVSEEAGGLAIRAGGHPHVWQRVVRGPDKRLRHVSLGIYETDRPALAERAKAAGALAPAPEGWDERSLWLRDPGGMLLELRVAPKTSPDAKTPAAPPSAAPGARGARMRDAVPQVRPSRLGHALFFTPDLDAVLEFYRQVVGLRVSDFPGPVAFLHGVYGSDHHLIAFSQSREGVGYHHAAWDVPSVEDVGLGAMQMAAAGFGRGGWGLGRHVLGSNYFHYVRDPWDSYAEYSFDIDYVPAEVDWVTGYPAPENSFYLWGPDAPEDFNFNYEAARLKQGQPA